MTASTAPGFKGCPRPSRPRAGPGRDALRWTDEAVVRESELWVHVPAAGILVENGERLLVHPPSRRGTSRVWRSWPTRDRAVGLILETIEEVRESGGGRLVWHTGDAIFPPFMDDLLSRHGFEKTEDLEVLAFELGDDLCPRLPQMDIPRDLRVDLVRDAAGLREAHAIESRVFPTPLNSPNWRYAPTFAVSRSRGA